VHSPNGHFVAVIGDREYKSIVNGILFAWAPDASTYAVLGSTIKLTLYKSLKERPGVGMKGVSLHGGTLYLLVFVSPLITMHNISRSRNWELFHSELGNLT